MQETHDKHSQLFKLLVLEHLKLKNQLSDAESEKREKQHAAEVERLQEQIDRGAKLQKLLKNKLESALLEQSKSDKQLDTAQNALKERALNDQKLKAKCEENDAKTQKAESKLAEFKSQSIEWLHKLQLLNREMNRKSTQLSLTTEFPSCLYNRVQFSEIPANYAGLLQGSLLDLRRRLLMACKLPELRRARIWLRTLISTITSPP